MADLHRRFGDKIEFIGVNVGVNERREGVKGYVKENGISFMNVFDQDRNITRSFGVMGTPSHIVIDRKGVIRYVSASAPGDLESHLKGLLE